MSSPPAEGLRMVGSRYRLVDLPHRDIKPSNVLLGHGHRIVLTDFGIGPGGPVERGRRLLLHRHRDLPAGSSRH